MFINVHVLRVKGKKGVTFANNNVQNFNVLKSHLDCIASYHMIRFNLEYTYMAQFQRVMVEKNLTG